MGYGPCPPRGQRDGGRGARIRCGRTARPRHEPAAQPAERPQFRILLGRPAADRKNCRSDRKRHPATGRRHLGKTLRREQPGDQPSQQQYDRPDPRTARDVPPSVRNRRKGGAAVDDHDLVQQTQRHLHRGTRRPAHDRTARRVGLQRARHFGLARRREPGLERAGGQRPADAGTGQTARLDPEGDPTGHAVAARRGPQRTARAGADPAFAALCEIYLLEHARPESVGRRGTGIGRRGHGTAQKRRHGASPTRTGSQSGSFRRHLIRLYTGRNRQRHREQRLHRLARTGARRSGNQTGQETAAGLRKPYRSRKGRASRAEALVGEATASAGVANGGFGRRNRPVGPHAGCGRHHDRPHLRRTARPHRFHRLQPFGGGTPADRTRLRRLPQSRQKGGRRAERLRPGRNGFVESPARCDPRRVAAGTRGGTRRRGRAHGQG